MSLNIAALNGKLPHFDGNYKAGEGEGKSFLSWAVSVPRDYKKPDDQYYPEDLLNFKAFGPTADFINKFFKQGDGIVISGRIQRDEDYEKDGQTVKGQMYILVEKAMFQAGKAGGSEGGNASAGGSKPSAPKPSAGGPKKPPVGGPKKPGGRPF